MLGKTRKPSMSLPSKPSKNMNRHVKTIKIGQDLKKYIKEKTKFINVVKLWENMRRRFDETVAEC
tara:strand:- start:554 stop:748 length:195 start_codon:yes stop_codon:yes gene_type:complete